MEKLEKDLRDWSISSDDCGDEDGAGVDQTIQQEINELETVLTESGIEGLKQKLHEKCEKWKKIKLNTAVTGISGAGKSSLINATLDLSPEEDENAAKVDVKETTADLTPYYHPNNQNFVVWDMPGVGTPKFPKENYLEAVKFDRYDFSLIVPANRFTENDEWLAKQIQSRKKRFYFIRTGIDVDILKNKKSKPRKHQQAAVMKVVRDDCDANLTKATTMIKQIKCLILDDYKTSY
ncbi:interferon-inducible GTPase 1-like [Mercenaria mercenaria]|uniref:interferon-inducible GTPase 1-like n=1 Tax=Mercenaria mercenaria TaxID=6596 RepID=UPI00234EDBDF|nr:interferon-inducible GTPase 1-like [Mercenaria mercenaria]